MAINKTVQAVFDKAMYLIDAQNEQTGSTSGADVNEYRVRTIGILNVLLDGEKNVIAAFAGDSREEQNTALLTLALYLFL